MSGAQVKVATGKVFLWLFRGLIAYVVLDMRTAKEDILTLREDVAFIKGKLSGADKGQR